MGKTYTGKVNFGGIFSPSGATPLDDRTVVKTKDDLTKLGAAVYKGMVVSVTDENTMYYLNADSCTSITDWKKVNSNEIKLEVDENHILSIKI